MNNDERQALATRVRDACIDAALEGYEDAAISRPCGEGALEVAISAIRRLDLAALVDAPAPDGDRPKHYESDTSEAG